MSEQLPSFEKVRSNGVEHELTRDNAFVFTHLGKLAIYDHLYVKTGGSNAVYLWRFAPSTGQEVSLYHHIKPKALENDCQSFLNLKEVNEKDIETYVRHATEDLKDTPPEWTEE